eukprot:GHRQ01037816.1.p1 GENE.GHRQ01037816.1~~GHRQ01037816.1.p1  ORF type:complete len:296 (+),score=134.26 GHRQ01037816.1:181-1068(+)
MAAVWLLSASTSFLYSWSRRFTAAFAGDALAHIEGCGLGRLAIPLVQVFARVSPEQKELVLQTLRAGGWVTLMVGDGTNDVGGLKAAHVGVALLAPSALAELKKKAKERGERKSRNSKAAAAAVGGTANSSHPQQGAVVPAGERAAAKSGRTSPGAVAAAGSGSSEQAKSKKKGEKLKPGEALLEQYRAAGKPVPASLQRMAAMLDKMEEDTPQDVPMVKPGDASMASPFTAKAASVAPVTDILKQGRCTLVTTVQMFKILGLLCLSTAYALSVMYLQGVKLSDAQVGLRWDVAA